MSVEMTPSRVIKFPGFQSALPERPLYIYLPPGYDQDLDAHYPVLYMHDGQNVFQTFVDDSAFGSSWQAEVTADRLISLERMQKIIIVGVGNGGDRRGIEYLPPYVSRPVEIEGQKKIRPGISDQVAEFYIDELAPFIASNFRIKTGREHTATCGASMGGLLSLFIAWEYAEFGRHHGIVSPALWLTKGREDENLMLARIARSAPPDVRIWLDSGTMDECGPPSKGDDGMDLTTQARDVLIEKGFDPGPDFWHYLDKGGAHSEAAWARRLPLILQFLFPGSKADEDFEPGR